MKMYFRFALMAALVGGVSLAVISCKSDDDTSEDFENEERTSTVGETSHEEVQLATLIASFTGLQGYDLMQTSGWQSKTYEAKLGQVMDESRPTVRTIKTTTVEDADERAMELLDILGIDYANPNGFTFSDASVGTVSYQHGGGDANTVAVINISVKQLPGITQLRMVKDMGSNAGEGFYKLGDIVQKNNRLWICVKEAPALGDRAVFVTFHDKHKTDKSGWWPYDDITYHNEDGMADFSTLESWVANFLMNDANYNRIINTLTDKNWEDEIYQVLPPTFDDRVLVVSAMTQNPTDMLEEPEYLKKYEWEELKTTGTRVAPRGMLLSDTFRWQRGTHHSYWVPYVAICLSDGYEADIERYQGKASQNNASKFKFSVSKKYELKFEHIKNDAILEKSYYIFKLAAFWQHRYYGPNNNNWSMFDFTKDWSEHDDENAMDFFNKPWLSRNITSRKYECIDNGTESSGLISVAVTGNNNYD